MPVIVALCLAMMLAGCSRTEPPGDAGAPKASAAPVSVPPARPPEVLYLPDGGDVAPPRAPGQQVLPGPWGFHAAGRCPPDMVDIGHRFCIDRYEDVLVDVATGRDISPYYHPTRQAARSAFGIWQKKHLDDETERGRSMAVPAPPSWELGQEIEPKAVVRAGAVPNGYLDALTAGRACAAAGKRLCTPAEWVTACRGEANRKFPYGTSYEAGKCNVFREAHPAAVLHANASIDHLDPRLNLVTVGGRPLLRPTGATASCKSQWGDDAVYDMVGNLDEWVDADGGLFLGGFYSRNTREGCDARVSAHPEEYYDYSLGVRCCK